MELRIRMSQMPDETPDFTHPPISWWRHEPKRTATGYRWLDWLTKPYWRYQSRRANRQFQEALADDLQATWAHLLAIIQTPLDDPLPTWEDINGNTPIPIEYLAGQNAISISDTVDETQNQ